MISSIRGKKRKVLVANTNKRKKVEIIHYDMFRDNTGAAEGTNDNPWALSFRSQLAFNATAAGSIESWAAFPLFWPVLGTSSFARKGECIRMKFILIKGYISVNKVIYRTVHYRLVLLNCKKNSVTGALTANQYLQKFYRNVEAFNDSANTREVAIENEAHALHNFHKGIIDSDLDRDIHRKVLFKGIIKPNAGMLGGSYSTVGSNPQYGQTDQYTIHNVNPSWFDIIPIKMTVKCDDYVNCLTDKYCIVLETDYVATYLFGSTAQPQSYGTAAQAPFTFNFFTQGYFTDS